VNEVTVVVWSETVLTELIVSSTAGWIDRPPIGQIFLLGLIAEEEDWYHRTTTDYLTESELSRLDRMAVAVAGLTVLVRESAVPSGRRIHHQPTTATETEETVTESSSAIVTEITEA
jgi:hypothetical protein